MPYIVPQIQKVTEALGRRSLTKRDRKNIKEKCSTNQSIIKTINQSPIRHRKVFSWRRNESTDDAVMTLSGSAYGSQ